MGTAATPHVRPTTGRALLATPRGRALVGGPVRAGVGQGRFLDALGTVLDLVGLVGDLVGAGSGPDVDIEELLAEHGEMLEAILAGQQDLVDGIGGVAGQVGGVSGQVGEIADLIEQIKQSSGQQQQDLKDQLSAMMDEQRRQAALINANIEKLSGQVSGLWADMNGWFASTLGEIDQLAQDLDVLKGQVARIESLLQDVLAELAELRDRVDWSSIITLLSEHEYRVAYGSAAALEVPVTVADTGTAEDGGNGGARIAVDPDGLRAWAQATADEVTGLPYSLYVIHRVMTGDTLLGKSLMDVFCRLAQHKDELTLADVGQYFLRLASLQAQGYAAVGKARQALVLPSTQDELFASRLHTQVEVFRRTLASVYGVDEWTLSVHGQETAAPKHFTTSLGWGGAPTRMLLTKSMHWVATGISLGLTADGPVTATTAAAVKGSWDLQAGSEQRDDVFLDGSTYALSDLLNFAEQRDQVLRYHPRTYCWPSDYVLVGVCFSTLDGALLFEPLLANYRTDHGVTSWDGTAGNLYKVTPTAPWPEPVELRVGDRSENGRWAAQYTHHISDGVPLAEQPVHPRGLTFRIVTLKDAESTSEQVHRLDLLVTSDEWTHQTTLPHSIEPVSPAEVTRYEL